MAGVREEENLTPKKIYVRNPCYLCGCSYESRYMIRIFGKSGIEKDLCAKIVNTCGVVIRNDANSSSKLICRKCEAFISKMVDFREKCQSMQVVEEASCSEKRCVEISPSSKQPPKRSAQHKQAKPCTAAKTLIFQSETVAVTPTPAQFILPMPGEINNLQQLFEIHDIPLTEIQKKKIILAANTKQPVVVAGTIFKECPGVLSSVKLSIVDELKSACQNLCRRSGGSELYDKNYDSMQEFDFEKLWSEMEANVPFLVDIFNAVSGNTSIEDVKQGLKVKYCFLYSILMHERWNELSLLKRVNTVLAIEGGCTKQVWFFVYYINVVGPLLSDQVIFIFRRALIRLLIN